MSVLSSALLCLLWRACISLVGALDGGDCSHPPVGRYPHALSSDCVMLTYQFEPGEVSCPALARQSTLYYGVFRHPLWQTRATPRQGHGAGGATTLVRRVLRHRGPVVGWLLILQTYRTYMAKRRR